jgi:hypothetical protein
MSVGVLELFVLGLSSRLWAFESDVDLLVSLGQPSIGVGVAKGIKRNELLGAKIALS